MNQPIDNATLAEWEQEEPSTSRERDLLVEIQRLREELKTEQTLRAAAWKHLNSREDGALTDAGAAIQEVVKLTQALAAHRAVIRELAEALTTLLEELGWSHAESENERRLLAHPLVVAAREGGGRDAE